MCKMVKLIIYKSTITLNVNGLNVPTKRLEWVNGCRNNTHIHTTYKTLISELMTHTKWVNEKRKSMQNGNQKKTRVVILLSYKKKKKKPFKIQTVRKDTKKDTT